jgi:hypothetical protein
MVLLICDLMDFSGSVINLFHVCEFDPFEILEGMVGTKFFSLDGLGIK